MVVSRCRYLDLYDPVEDRLTDWGQRVWNQMGSVNPTRIYSLDRHRSEIVDQFWDRHDGRSGASLTETQIVALEQWLDENSIPKICPHPVHGDTRRCPFHLPADELRDAGVSDHELRQMFLRKIRATNEAGQASTDAYRMGKCFVGTQWAELDLRHVVLTAPDNYPVDLRMARIDRLILDHATVEQPLQLDRCRIDEASFIDTDFQWSVGFRHARFSGDEVSFEGSRFGGVHVDFSRAAFHGSRICFDHAVFDARKTSFSRAEFRPGDDGGPGSDRGGEVSFYRARFNGGDADFTLVQFGRRMAKGEFSELEESSENGTDEHGGVRADFCRAVFSGGDADFGAAEFFDGAKFKLTEFTGGYANFSEAQFFGSDTSFQDADFGRSEVDFSWARFETTTADFKRIRGGDADVFFTDTRSTRAPINLSQADVGSGKFRVPEGEATVYNLEGARLGSVELTSASGLRMFDCFRLLDTEFDGFDFSRYNDDLAETNWVIHRATESGGLEHRENIERRLSPGELEATYMKAKIGASRMGHTKASAEFFQKELLFRREKHASQVFDWKESLRVRLRSAWRWMANSLLWWVTGYGERPFRVVSSSIVVIGFFVAAFELGWAAIPEAPRSAYQGMLGSLLLSFESFTTLVLGGGNVETQIIRLIGYVEGFIGAFLIALFVFTITRSIRR